MDIFAWSVNFNLMNFDYIDDKGVLKKNINIKNEIFKNLKYGCGIYTLKINK